ncbi:MAG: hypothetical protein ABI867_06190 [Kofleriaceae bacterium]
MHAILPDAAMVAELAAVTGELHSTVPAVANATSFDAKLVSKLFVTDSSAQIADLWDARIACLATAPSAEALVALVEAACEAARPIVVIAPRIDEGALALLAANRLRGLIEAAAVTAEPPVIAAIARHLGVAVIDGDITLAATGSARRTIAAAATLVLA